MREVNPSFLVHREIICWREITLKEEKSQIINGQGQSKAKKLTFYHKTNVCH